MDHATYEATQSLVRMGRELREARLNRDLTLEIVARAVGISAIEVSRIERGRRPTLGLVRLGRLFAAVGMELSVRAYPGPSPIRDRPQNALTARFRERLPAGTRWMAEHPVGPAGDQRAWDGMFWLAELRIAVEAETHPRDLQELARRLALKERDGAPDRLILLLLDSRANRAALRGPNPLVGPRFPISGRAALAAIEAGKDPGGNAIVLL